MSKHTKFVVQSIYTINPFFMKKIIFTILTMATTSCSLFAQDKADVPTQKGVFTYKGEGSLNFTSSLFSTYQTSGNSNNTQGAVAKFNFTTNWKKGKHNWDNDLKLMLGGLQQTFVVTNTVDSAGNPTSYKKVKASGKNQDLISFTTKYGYTLTPKLSIAGLGNLQTQFVVGYKDPFVTVFGKEKQVNSGFMAPGLINFGLGLDWKPFKDFSVYYSPVNSKITVCSIDSLRKNFSIYDDQKMRYEFGSFLDLSYRKELFKRIVYSTKLQLFTNYIKSEQVAGRDMAGRPGTIDVQLWQNSLSIAATKWLGINFTANMMYDEDTKFDARVDDNKIGLLLGYKGPRTQYNHTLGVGLTYNFHTPEKK